MTRTFHDCVTTYIFAVFSFFFVFLLVLLVVVVVVGRRHRTAAAALSRRCQRSAGQVISVGVHAA